VVKFIVWLSAATSSGSWQDEVQRAERNYSGETQVHDDGTAGWILNETPSGMPPFEDAAKREARGVMNFQHRVLSTLLVDSDSTEPCSFPFADILELSVAQSDTIFICSQSGSKVQLLDRTGPDGRTA
jgi:hypothetical protein